MKLLNLPPVKVGQYVRYRNQYIWKCSSVSLNRHKEWMVKGQVIASLNTLDNHSWRPGMPIGWAIGDAVSGYWSDMDVLLTEEETNAIIERTTV